MSDVVAPLWGTILAHTPKQLFCPYVPDRAQSPAALILVKEANTAYK